MIVISVTIFFSIVVPFVLGRLYLQLPFLALELPDLISRIGLYGVLVVSSLSGFGSVEFPFRRLSALIVPVTATQVRKIVTDLSRANARTSEKRKQLEELYQHASGKLVLDCSSYACLSLVNAPRTMLLPSSAKVPSRQLKTSNSRFTNDMCIAEMNNSQRDIKTLEDELEIMTLLKRELAAGKGV